MLSRRAKEGGASACSWTRVGTAQRGLCTTGPRFTGDSKRPTDRAPLKRRFEVTLDGALAVRMDEVGEAPRLCRIIIVWNDVHVDEAPSVVGDGAAGLGLHANHAPQLQSAARSAPSLAIEPCQGSL